MGVWLIANRAICASYLSWVDLVAEESVHPDLYKKLSFLQFLLFECRV